VAVFGVASQWSSEALISVIILGAVGLAVCIYVLGLPIVVALLGPAIVAVAIFEAGSEPPLPGLAAAGALGLAVFVGALGPEILVSIIGAAVTAMVVLGVGSSLTFEKLLAGTVIGTFVPALAVAFEGLCGVLHEIRELAPRRFDDTQPRPRPTRITFETAAILVTDRAVPAIRSSNELTSSTPLTSSAENP
jgi:hypothetical protein